MLHPSLSFNYLCPTSLSSWSTILFSSRPRCFSASAWATVRLKSPMSYSALIACAGVPCAGMLVPVCLCSVESVSDCIYFFCYFSFQGTPCPYLIQAAFPCFDRRHAVRCMPYKQVVPVAPGEVLRLVSVMLVAQFKVNKSMCKVTCSTIMRAWYLSEQGSTTRRISSATYALAWLGPT